MSKTIIISEKEILNLPNDADLGEYIRRKYWENDYDKCIICGKPTPYTKYTHILDRINYIEGAGQTCVETFECGK